MTVPSTTSDAQRTMSFTEIGPAQRGSRSDEVVLAVSPAFVGAPLVIVSHASILAGRGRACGDLTTGRPRASGRRASAERKVDRAVTSV